MSLLKSTLFLSILCAHFSAASSDGILIIGDTGKDNPGQRKVTEAMKKHCEKELCNMGMLAGDVVYEAGVSSSKDPILEKVFDAYYNDFGFQWLIALGNHDYGKLSNDWKRGRYQKAHAKKNPLFVLPHYWYIHETPNAVISVIDTARLMWIKDRHGNRDIIREGRRLAEESGKWFIVMGHHPYVSNGKHGNAGNYDSVPTMGWLIKRMIKRQVCGKAHFYISGHEHLLQLFDGRVNDCEDTQLVVSGAAASASDFHRSNPSYFQADKRGFFHMLVSEEEAEIKAIDENNKRLYRAIYRKKDFNR